MKKTSTLDVERLSDREVTTSFYLSQGLLFVIGCIGLFLFHRSVPPFSQLFAFSINHVIVLGFGSGILLALLEWGLDKILPETWLDDGGINRRIFKALSRFHIVLAMLIVAVIEEFLFRGILQSQFGWIAASLIFGLVHIRYIKKPLMLIVAICLGFYLGWLYIYTGSLLAPIAAHFSIDAILGFVLKHTTERK